MSMRAIKSEVKSLIAPYPTLRTWVARTHNLSGSIVASLRKSETDYLNELAERKRDVYFIQIGAHDGQTDDHLNFFVRRYGWKGILVEPVKYLFNTLVDNYRGYDGLIFENKAISEEDGTRIFYRFREDAGLPGWCSQLGSFNREVVLSHKYWLPGLEKHLIQERIECISFETLMKRHNINQVDLILIDTEGHDFQILLHIDFKELKPDLVIYEQKHLSGKDQREAIKLLSSEGYIVRRVGIGWNNVATRRSQR